jgi:hypothetical protein
MDLFLALGLENVECGSPEGAQRNPGTLASPDLAPLYPGG